MSSFLPLTMNDLYRFTQNFDKLNFEQRVIEVHWHRRGFSQANLGACLAPWLYLGNVQDKRYKLVLIINRKSYMSFRLVPQSVTLTNLERRNGPYFALFQFADKARKGSRGISKPKWHVTPLKMPKWGDKRGNWHWGVIQRDLPISMGHVELG